MKIWKQILSILVSACLVVGMLPMASLAAESNGETINTSGLCEHHTAHDETCGYVKGIAESPCTHEHGEGCYTWIKSCTHTHTEDCYPVLDSSIPDDGTTVPAAGNVEGTTPSGTEPLEDTTPSEAVEPTECGHTCSEGSGCMVQELNCPHEHDEACGYVPAVEEHPCIYVCELCGLTEIMAWSWVDELEVIDPVSGILALSGDGAESPVLYEEIVDMLPEQITATTEDGTETVTLNGWTCDNYPEMGAYTGSYLFTAVLPEGYALAENVPVLTVKVEFGGVAVLEGTEHNHPICGATHTDIGNHTGTCEDVPWTAWNGTDEITYDADTNTAYVYLADNVIRDNTFEVKSDCTLYLCLNGHSITSSYTGEVICVDNNAKFILCNCQSGGTITHSDNVLGKGVQVGSSGSDGIFIMYGGTISGNHVGTSGSKEDGAGVATSSRGTFTMYGGTISDNHTDVASYYGGGGVLSGGKFIMYGGTISSNTVTGDGGGVVAWGTWASATIYGGIISGNTATGNGGGVCTNNSLIISGNSVIENNKATKGGGVYFYGYYSDSEILTISDSVKITGNTATGDGGGIYCANGGAFMMNGGSITGNTATGNGGGVYFNSKHSNAFKFSGSVDISGNKKDSADNNVYLPTGKYITITGKLTGGKKIGVTTEAAPDSSGYVRIASGNKNYAKPEKFQYENDETPVSAVISSSGSNATLVVCKHNLRADWSTDSSNHWHECSICKGKEDIATHVYNQKVAREGYKVSEATCTSGAIYHISCVCGKEGTETFESGDKNPDNHSGTVGAWQSDDSKHWKEYSCCRAKAETAAHIGGTATCQSPAVCSTCSQHYGDKDMSNHTGGTEVRGRVEATTSATGYTGDTYCKGCNTKIENGKIIPKKSNGDGNSSRGNSSNTGDGNDSSSNNNAPSTPVTTSVTVPVSGDEKTIQVDAAVRGTTATIENVNLTKLDTVIGDNVKTGVVTIDFSVLEKKVDTVKLPANVVKQIAEAVNDSNNDAESLEILLTDGTSMEFDAKILGKMTKQAGSTDITISIKKTTDKTLNNKQQQTVGNRPALDITVLSGGKRISDMGGKVTIYVPYELRSGERAGGIVVYYVDSNGNRELCETSYDAVKKRVNWKTNHFSVYMIGYDESKAKLTKNLASNVYIVKQGDTLSTIAKKYGCTVSGIMTDNSALIKNPNRIYMGWQLKIPQD